MARGNWPVGATCGELYGLLGSSIAPDQIQGVRLLGDHTRRHDAGGPGTYGSAIYGVVRQVTTRWPRLPPVLCGHRTKDLIRESRLNCLPPKSNRVVLRRLLEQVDGLRGNARGGRDAGRGTSPSLIPALDRRSAVLQAMGVSNLLYTNHQPDPRLHRGERTHPYLDVSDSIGPLKAALHGPVLDYRDFVHPTVHLFSTEVADVSLAEMRRGVCRTTGGTDIRCVAAHLRQQRIRRAVLVTDGCVGRPVGEDQATLADLRLGVALTPGRPNRQDLADVADHWIQLTEP